MIRRFSFIAVTVLMWAVLVAAPAWAAEVKFVEPTPASNATVTGTRTIRAQATPCLGEQVNQMTIRVAPRAGVGGSAREWRGPGSDLTVSWETQNLHNGAYDFHASATTSALLACGSNGASISNVKVNNPASTPSGLKCSRGEGGVGCSWSPNPEPDLVHYKVLRSVGDGGATQLATVQGTSYKDAAAPPDQRVSYRIVAVRRSATGGTLESGPSAAVNVDPGAAPPATPAPPPPGSPEAQAPPAPVPVPAAAAPPPANSPAAPKFGKPQFKTLTGGGIGVTEKFDPVLPYSAPIPENFEPPAVEGPSIDASDLEADAGVSGTLTQVDPARFVAAGLLMLVVSAHLALASRRLMRSGRPPRKPKGGAGPVSPLHA
ncbi:MAG: hypothetical protein M3164_05680 [Actinomycetota bacterium]|nr:hypothetical protein [Actinomycetota bacterium]